MSNLKARQLDFYMAAVIFVVSVLELISWKLQEGKEAVITDVGNNYLVYYYPLLNTLIIWFFALFFFLKILRYNSCIYTIIVSTVYFFIQSVNVSAFFFGFGMGLYETIAYPALLFGVIILTLTKIVRWCLK